MYQKQTYKIKKVRFKRFMRKFLLITTLVMTSAAVIGWSSQATDKAIQGLASPAQADGHVEKCIETHPYSCLIRETANRYQIPDKALLMAKIVKCESGFNPNAERKTSTAAGLAQWIVGSWEGLPYHIRIRSRYEPEAAIEAMAYQISNYGTGAWNESKSCWIK